MCVGRRDGPGTTTSKQTNGRRDNLATTAPQVTQLPAWLLPELRWDVVTLKSLPAPAAPANCTWLPLRCQETGGLWTLWQWLVLSGQWHWGDSRVWHVMTPWRVTHHMSWHLHHTWAAQFSALIMGPLGVIALSLMDAWHNPFPFMPLCQLSNFLFPIGFRKGVTGDMMGVVLRCPAKSGEYKDFSGTGAN